MKRIIAVLVCLLLVTGLSACSNSKDTEYSHAGITLTLPENFTEISKQEDEYSLQSNSGTVVIVCSHADQAFLDENNLGDVDLAEITSMFEEGREVLEHKECGAYNWFSFKEGNAEEDLYYMVVVYDTNDGYWLVNFICDNADLKNYQNNFLKWAEAVRFE